MENFKVIFLNSIVQGAAAVTIGTLLDWAMSKGPSNSMSETALEVSAALAADAFLTWKISSELASTAFIGGPDPAGGIAWTIGLIASQPRLMSKIQTLCNYLSTLLELGGSGGNGQQVKMGTSMGTNTINGAASVDRGDFINNNVKVTKSPNDFYTKY